MKAKQSGGFFSFSLAIMFIAGVVFFFMSVIALGVLPGIRLEKAILQHSPAGNVPYTAEEWRGRQIYAAQGCAYCHSQQVRFTAEDRRRFGPSTEAWETRYDSPQLWGTRRIGPDLARESGVRSDDWQYAHLYNPRDVVPDSVMPAYPWMFSGSAGRPGDEARAIVAYLRTLGRARAQQDAAAGNVVPQDYANPSRPIPAPLAALRPGPLPPLPVGNRFDGRQVWQHYCSACHGQHADGQTLAARSLRPAPANLTAFHYDRQTFTAILHNGVAGSAMPAWRDLSSQQVADLYAWLNGLKPQAAAGSVVPAGRSPSAGSVPPAQTAPAAGTASPSEAAPAAVTTGITAATDDAFAAGASAAAEARGATLYAQNCTTCHGVNGDGHGPSAALYAPAPFSFLHLQPDVAEIDRVLRNGVPGSAMPPFPQFSSGQRADLSHYIRSLHQPERPSPLQHKRNGQ